jgi:hypothetical protein
MFQFLKGPSLQTWAFFYCRGSCLHEPHFNHGGRKGYTEGTKGKFLENGFRFMNPFLDKCE